MIDVAELARLCFALGVQPSGLFERVEEWVVAEETDESEGGDATPQHINGVR